MAFRYWLIEHPLRGQYVGHHDLNADRSELRAIFNKDNTILLAAEDKPKRFYHKGNAEFVLTRCPSGCVIIEGRNPA